MNSAHEPLLDRDSIERAFRLLGQRLHASGVVADIYVVGGAAMVLAYDARRATRDVDAVFVPHGVVLQAAAQVAAELGLPRSWLNDQASVYVSPTPDRQAPRVFDSPGVRVSAASAEHLLAMKALAGRRYADRDDLAVLLRVLGITTTTEVADICARVFPDEPLTDRSRLLIEDVLADLASEPASDAEQTAGTPPTSDPASAGTRCAVCGRPLTSAESITRGVGPRCAHHA